MAEALVARCAAAVAQCRVDLAELSAACAAARSHKELCSELAAAAAEAVAGLEQLAALAEAEPGRLRSAQKLATAVQSALDQASAAGACPGASPLVSGTAQCSCLDPRWQPGPTLPPSPPPRLTAQGDAVVRTYGHQAGLLSVLSRLASRLDSSKARASFEALTSELQNLGKKVGMMRGHACA